MGIGACSIRKSSLPSPNRLLENLASISLTRSVANASVDMHNEGGHLGIVAVIVIVISVESAGFLL